MLIKATGIEMWKNVLRDENDITLSDDGYVEEEPPYINEKGLSLFDITTKLRKQEQATHASDTLKRVKLQLKKVDSITSLITVSSIIISSFEYNIYDNNNKTSTLSNHILRSILIILSIFNCFVLYHHYTLTINLHKTLKLTHQNESLRTSPLLKYFVLECAINALICPPAVDAKFDVEQLEGRVTLSLPGLCYAAHLLKAYSLFRLPEQYSRWTNDTSSAICKRNKCKASVGFLVKCEFKTRPYVIVLLGFGLVTVFLGMLLKIFDSEYVKANGTKDSRSSYFSQFTNSFWFLLVTMLTVGMGDSSPTTYFGRLICAVGCIIGTMISSLMVVSLQNFSALTVAETRVFHKVEEDHQENTAKKKSAALLYQAFKLYTLNKQIKKKKEANEVNQGSLDLDAMQIKKYALLSSVAKLSPSVLSNHKGTSKADMSAEDTLLRLCEGRLAPTDKTFSFFRHSTEIRTLCSEIIEMQTETNLYIDAVIKYNNCMGSFLGKVGEYWIQENGEGEK